MRRAEPTLRGLPTNTRAWWLELTAWRASPQQFGWLVLTCGVAACLLTIGCGTRHEAPFAQTPESDIAVTTLDKTDIDSVAALIQVQDAILRGCDVAEQHPLPEALKALLADIREQQLSRGRDLSGLVKVKHAPEPAVPSARHAARLDHMARAPGPNWTGIVVTFQRDTHTEALRLLRDAGDRSLDPDVQAFAKRQLPGVASILERLERNPDAR